MSIYIYKYPLNIHKYIHTQNYKLILCQGLLYTQGQHPKVKIFQLLPIKNTETYTPTNTMYIYIYTDTSLSLSLVYIKYLYPHMDGTAWPHLLLGRCLSLSIHVLQHPSTAGRKTYV